MNADSGSRSGRTPFQCRGREEPDPSFVPPSVKDHHFDLAASNAKERQLWIDMLSLAISRATFSPPGSEAAFPCSLFFGDAADGESLEASEAPTPNANRPAEFQAYFDTAKAGTVDPLMEFFAMHAAGAAQANSNQKGQRSSSSGPWMPTEILLRHASSTSRNIVDRGMVLSDSVISARIARDGGALSTLYAASGSGIGSAVGSSLGLSRLSARRPQLSRSSAERAVPACLRMPTLRRIPTTWSSPPRLSSQARDRDRHRGCNWTHSTIGIAGSRRCSRRPTGCVPLASLPPPV